MFLQSVPGLLDDYDSSPIRSLPSVRPAAEICCNRSVIIYKNGHSIAHLFLVIYIIIQCLTNVKDERQKISIIRNDFLIVDWNFVQLP